MFVLPGHLIFCCANKVELKAGVPFVQDSNGTHYHADIGRMAEEAAKAMFGSLKNRVADDALRVPTAAELTSARNFGYVMDIWSFGSLRYSMDPVAHKKHEVGYPRSI
jgi:hypothetical protein